MSSTMPNMSAASSSVALDICLMSPPAKKVFFAEVMMMPLMEVSEPSPISFSRRSTVAQMSSWKVLFMVLTGAFGSSMVRVTIPASS